VGTPGQRSLVSHLRAIVAFVALLAPSGVALAHQPSSADLPDAPTPKQDAANTQPKSETPLKATIGILGKRSVFFPELAFDRGPLSAKKKLELAVDETVAPSRFLGSAFTSGIGQARNALPGYGQGWNGYGKRLGSSVASNASSHLFGTFLLPSMLHQDPRYFVKFFGNRGSRIEYALERALITRTDGGRETFNWSSLLGGLMAEGLANSYLPDGERTAGKTFSRFGIRVGFGALDNVIKEYWPNIFHSLRITKVVPNESSDPGTVTPPEGPQSHPISEMHGGAVRIRDDHKLTTETCFFGTRSQFSGYSNQTGKISNRSGNFKGGPAMAVNVSWMPRSYVLHLWQEDFFAFIG
jgi:hypothetical protein